MSLATRTTEQLQAKLNYYWSLGCDVYMDVGTGHILYTRCCQAMTVIENALLARGIHPDPHY